MTSQVANPELAAALDQWSTALDAVEAATVEPVDERDAAVVAREIEERNRRGRALGVEVVDVIDRRRLYRADGHASAKVMVRHAADLSEEEAGRRAKVARALRDLPEVKAAYAAGAIGTPQVDRIARAHANVRVRERLCGHDRALVRVATERPYRDFDAALTDWVRIADEDGTCDRSQRLHENRDARPSFDFDGGFQFLARGGSLDGAEIATIFEAFERAEFEADWAAARAEHGDAATVDQLPRTAAQRRFDAYRAMCRAAATARADAPGGSVIETVLVMDYPTFERELSQMAGAVVVPLDPPLHPDETDPDETDPDETDAGRTGFRCSTLDGIPIDVTEATAQALVGQVRRAVVGADSVVIDLGRRQRLFTGLAQLAVRLSNMYCYWKGCHVPATHCQSDHLVPFNDRGGGGPDPGGGGAGGGLTNPANGGPACGRHNRFKEHGWTVRRDAAGELHIYRPDGSELE